MLKRRANKNIQTNIILAFSVLFILTILVIGTFSAYFLESILTNNTEEYTFQLIQGLNSVIDDYTSYIDDITYVLLIHDDIRSYINSEGNEQERKNISEYLNSIMEVRKDINGMYIILEDGRFISDNINDVPNEALIIKEEDWYVNAVEANTSAFITSSHVQNVIADEYPWVISLSREIRNDTGDEKKGILLVDLNYSIIEELCNEIKLGKSGYVFILNQNADIVFHPRQQLIYSDLKHEPMDEIIKLQTGAFFATVDNRQVLYSLSTSERTQWTIVGVSYINEIFFSKNELQFYLIMLGILCFITVIIISSFISAQITKPIEVLRASMQEVENGNFDIDISVNCNHEIYDLALDCEIAIKKIKELINQIKIEQEQKRINELKVLQAQINPHFLYNTLDSIIWLTECNQPDDAITMTESLAHFFRLSLSRGKEIIPIRQVVDHIQCYLTIQKIRYKNTLDYRVVVDPEIYPYYSLKLLLQPIVENAIYHGIKNRNCVGHIQITGKRIKDYIQFEVIDDGIGMGVEELSNLENGITSSLQKSGVGIKNVKERIKLFFGDNFGIDFKTKKDRGTTVTIRLPIMESIES